MSRSKGRSALLRAGIVSAVLAAALVGASSAGATTYTWVSNMDAAQQAASHLPADTGASGTATITGDTSTNQMCGTFTWSGIHGAVGFGHIHQAEYGQPENIGFTINLFGPPTSTSGFQSGVTGCTIVPGPLMTEMSRFQSEFMVTIHTTSFPGGAIRGQLGTGRLICEISSGLCPGPLVGTF